jgi:multimeric flavodoxin WrbA
MKIRKIGDSKPKVLVFQGSPRDAETCPNMNSKTHKIVEYMVSKWSPFIDFQVIDLSVNPTKRPTIQPCKGCVSTAGGFHCHFPCSCFRKGSEKQPDLLSELNVYGKLQESDAFVIVSPIHWHALTSQVKLLFDRLVCVNQALHVDDAKNLMGADNIKNSEVTGKFARSGKYDQMLRNHIEGKVCAFYVHGDDGANEYVVNELPESFDVLDDGFGNNPKNVVMPYVMQMKYSGVFVPDELIQAFYVNKGIDYYTANKKFNKEKEFFERMDLLMDNLLNYLDEKKNKENEN